MKLTKVDLHYKSLFLEYPVEVIRSIARRKIIGDEKSLHISMTTFLPNGKKVPVSAIEIIVSKVLRRPYMLKEFCPEIYKKSISKRFIERKEPLSIHEEDYGNCSLFTGDLPVFDYSKRYKLEEVVLDLNRGSIENFIKLQKTQNTNGNN